jgi:hypothetical protein
MLLLGEAVLCVLLYSSSVLLTKSFSITLAFPFEQIGLGLRSLSLLGGVANTFAIILYAALSLIPVSVLFLIKKKRKLYLEDALLVVLSAVSFVVLYIMVNPYILEAYMYNGMDLYVGKNTLGGIAYSVLAGYVVLRILRILSAADAGRVQKYLSILLYALCIILVYNVFGISFGSLMNAIDALKAGNIGNEQYLGISYVFLVLQYLVSAMPYIMDVLIVITILDMLKVLNISRYSEAAVLSAGKLSRICIIALVVTVLSNVLFNLLQLAFLKTLYAVNSTISIPLLSIALTMAVLLLSQHIKEGKQLKDDNDMFI